MTLSTFVTDHPHVELALDYQSPFPSNKTVTLTIEHLTLPVKPASPVPNQNTVSQQIDGPWVFSITPEMTATQPPPTPVTDVDRFAGVSVTEAQKLVSFPLVEPNPLPAPLTRKEFNVNGYALGVASSAPANYVMFDYEPQQPSSEQDVWLVETTNGAAVPIVNGDSVSLILPGPSGGTTRTMTISQGTKLTLPLGGVNVTTFKVASSATNTTTVYYVWKQAGVNYYIRHVEDVTSTGQALVSPGVLLQTLMSLITQKSGAIPTPDDSGRIIGITFEQAQQLTPFPIYLPTKIPTWLGFSGVEVDNPPLPPGTGNATPVKASLWFGSMNKQHMPVTIDESRLSMNPNNVSGAEVPVTNAAGTPTVMPADGVVSTIDINGTTVTRHDTANQQGTIISVYFWKQGPTSMMLTAMSVSQADEQDLEQMIASMIAQGS